MPDREKVSIGLMDISDYFFEMYRRSNEREEFELALDRHNIIEDTLALLKEQERQIKEWERYAPILAAHGVFDADSVKRDIGEWSEGL